MQVNCGIFHHSFSYLRVLEHWLYIYYNAIRRAKHFDDLHRVITKLVAGALTLNQFIHIKKLSDKKKKRGGSAITSGSKSICYHFQTPKVLLHIK